MAGLCGCGRAERILTAHAGLSVHGIEPASVVPVEKRIFRARQRSEDNALRLNFFAGAF
jgi:hypothetical protein